jgi:hypothetical protein
MYDPDVPSDYRSVAESMMQYYDWSLSTGGHDGQLIHQWERLSDIEEQNITWVRTSYLLNYYSDL